MTTNEMPRPSFFRRLVNDLREMGRELVEYHELFMTLVRRDVMVRYRRTLLGVGWALFTPVVNMIIFTVIFNRVAKIETDVPYPCSSTAVCYRGRCSRRR